MAVLPIRIWGDPVLKKKAQAVDRLTPADKKLIKDMMETMDAADGAGLAAPQVGVSKRIFVFRIGDERHALINPKITLRSGEVEGEEGCLSIPGVQAKVKRAKRVVISGRDQNNKPVSFELEDGDAMGRAATCVQHETDHLDGIMYLERAKPDSIVWLVEGIDDEGEETVLLRKTKREDIQAAYKAGQFPSDVHVSEMLRERVEREEAVKIAFMGTPQLAVPCLDALAEDHEIAVVVTQPDKMGGRRNHELLAPPVKSRALELGVPLLQPERARNEEFVAQLRAFEPNAIAVVAYGQILPRSILELAPRGCVNLHFSLLPRWRGAAPVQYALWQGDKKTGVTTQWMAEKLDSGDVIQQVEVPIFEDETSGELLNRLTGIGADVLRETFAMLESGIAPRTPQDESGVTLCPQITKEMAQIEWSMTAATIVNTVRAMNPWPVAWCTFRGEPLKIWRAKTTPPRMLAGHEKPGQIWASTNEGLFIVAGDEVAVQLLEVQAPGKPKMNAIDWARGARLAAGEMFE